MTLPRRHDRPIAFRSTGETAVVVEARFPRAITGEEYARYARATWRQADAWFQQQSPALSGEQASMHEARDLLSSAAATELGRALNPQEERLLSELLHRRVPAFDPRVEPEIPSFLLD